MQVVGIQITLSLEPLCKLNDLQVGGRYYMTFTLKFNLCESESDSQPLSLCIFWGHCTVTVTVEVYRDQTLLHTNFVFWWACDCTISICNGRFRTTYRDTYAAGRRCLSCNRSTNNPSQPTGQLSHSPLINCHSRHHLQRPKERKNWVAPLLHFLEPGDFLGFRRLLEVDLCVPFRARVDLCVPFRAFSVVCRSISITPSPLLIRSSSQKYNNIRRHRQTRIMARDLLGSLREVDLLWLQHQTGRKKSFS